MEQFELLKNEILKRAKEANACTSQYSRAYKAITVAELMAVVKDNFAWVTIYNVVNDQMIEQYKDLFGANNIYCNVDVQTGYCLASGNATVKAYGNATVKAYGNATVEASGNATVEAYDNATVEAYDNATVKAYDNATVKAYGNATVKACGNVMVEAYGNATVEAYDNATVKACGNVMVEAYGNAYIASYFIIECKLSDNAIYRIMQNNTIRYASEKIKFEKI